MANDVMEMIPEWIQSEQLMVQIETEISQWCKVPVFYGEYARPVASQMPDPVQPDEIVTIEEVVQGASIESNGNQQDGGQVQTGVV